jgi:hypothetical protein
VIDGTCVTYLYPGLESVVLDKAQHLPSMHKMTPGENADMGSLEAEVKDWIAGGLVWRSGGNLEGECS